MSDDVTFEPPDGVRPLPVPTALSQPYWDACARGELTYLRCAACGHPHFPPLSACPRCLSLDLHWNVSAGRGVVDTFTTVRTTPSPGFPVPVVLAIVDLNEGFSMFSNIMGCDPDEVSCEMPVEVFFQRASDEITLPMFRPAADPL